MDQSKDELFSKKSPVSNVEKNANYEGNHTLLFLERLNNPVIHERLIDNIVEHETTRRAKIIPETEGLPADYNTRAYWERTTDRLIKEAGESTDILVGQGYEGAYTYGRGSPVVMPTSGFDIQTDLPFTQKTLTIHEAHEKGHTIRDFSGESQFTDRLKKAFDFSKISKEFLEESKRLAEKGRKLNHVEGKPPLTDEHVIEYYSSPDELIERMAQLKNYFGMKGNELFTHEHLAYAREHYVTDTGVGIQMEALFQSVTPETEDAFIELMNTLGI